MTNIERLKLELSNKQYFTDAEYSVFLEENELIAMEQYNKSLDEVFLLQTIIAMGIASSNSRKVSKRIC